MASEDVSPGRRKFLTGTVSVVGGMGAAAAAVPFIKMWQPSAKAKAAGAPVEVTVNQLEPGQMLQVEWRGQPVWVVNRSKPMLDRLQTNRERLRDPDSDNTEQQPEYAQNEFRSVKPELLVLLGICTHLGCSPKFVPEMKPQPFDAEWNGGFFCPCHSSRFDLAGRVFAGVPAPSNLKVPPYSFLDGQRLLIGVGPEGTS
ncbi:MAG: ubiquinol-cytochrome c reductase iron-sulfur subunit [Pseudomonadota bacterium]